MLCCLLELRGTNGVANTCAAGLQPCMANVCAVDDSCVQQVYGKGSGGEKTLVACIEDHKFKPNNFW